MVARDDTVSTMLELATSRRTALLGEPHWDAWNDEQRVHGFSVLLDPAVTWRPDIGPIPDGGDPIGEFERSCRQFGIAAHPFPFTQDGYVIHRGRATLAGVLERGEHNHPLFDWAKDHHEPHFQGVLGARERYDALVAEFDRAGGTDDISSLVSFCRRHVAETR